MIPEARLNAIAQLVTVPAKTPFSALQKYLDQNEFFLGYQPLTDRGDDPLEFYLNHRIGNLYHYKYGSLADRVSSLEVELANGQKFCLNDAPRSAIGPDFNRTVIGVQNAFGKILNATLKTVKKPEKLSHLIVSLPGEKEASELVRLLVGQFLTPLYFVFVANLRPKKLLKNLKTKQQDNILILCHAGLEDLVETELGYVKSCCEEKDYSLHVVTEKKQINLVEKFINDRQTQEIIKQQLRSFLWPASDNQSQKMIEQEVRSHVR